MWESDLKGQVVLFDWIQFLQYSASEFLGIQDTLDLSWAYSTQPPVKLARTLSGNPPPEFSSQLSNSKLDSRAVRDNQFQGDLVDFLVDYDKSQKQAAFDKAIHSCKVCFEDKLGAQCLQFPICNHGKLALDPISLSES